MDRDQSADNRIRDEMQAFRSGFESLVLATVSSGGVPEASAAPMVTGDGGDFYIYVSGLSHHTSNLESNPRAGVLLIEPGAAAVNPFARERLSYDCTVTVVLRETPAYTDIMQRFIRRFGNIVETLMALPDFNLYCLTPVSGRYVRGFGQAWRLSGPGMSELEHLNPAADSGRPS